MLSLSNISLPLIDVSLSLSEKVIKFFSLSFPPSFSKLLEKTSDAIIKAGKTGDLGLVRSQRQTFYQFLFFIFFNSDNDGNLDSLYEMRGPFCLLKKYPTIIMSHIRREFHFVSLNFAYDMWITSILRFFFFTLVERTPSPRLFTFVHWSDGLDGTSSCGTLWT